MAKKLDRAEVKKALERKVVQTPPKKHGNIPL